MTPRILLVCVLLAMPAPGAAQDTSDLEQQLPGLTGLERARALADLTDALRADAPRKAVAYGREATALFESHADPANHVRTLNEMAWAYMMLGEYEQAIAHAERGRELAERHGERRGLARAINNLGVIARRRGEALAAVEHFAGSLEIYRQLDSALDVSMSLNNLGFVHATDLADYETGLAYHVEALRVREQLGDRAAIALSLNNIGIVYGRLGEYERSLEYFDRALALRRELGLQSRIAGTLNNIGDIHLTLGDHENALRYHLESLEIRRAIGEKSGVAISLKNLGEIYLAMGRTALARQHLGDGLALADGIGDRGTTAMSLLGLARLDREAGRGRAALRQAREALAIARQSGARELVRRSLEELAACQERVGDFAGALASYRQFKDVHDQIFDEERTKRVAGLERRYQAEKREREIQHLRDQQAIQELETNRQRLQRNAVAGATALLALVGFTFYRRRVESARLAEQLSLTDALTGLKNRRYLHQTIDADLAGSARRYRMAASGAPPPDADLVFILLDVDHFKAVNDRYGHEAGDRVLAQMAEILRETCRASDTLVRWGGEEFLIVCRFTGREQGAVLAERIRAAVAAHAFDLGGARRIQRTCSLGYAAYPFLPRAPEALTWEQVVGLADEALYLAKEAGRNRSVGLAPGTLGENDLDGATKEDFRRRIAEGRLCVETKDVTKPA